MTGGHGTAGGFASVLEGMGLHDAATLCAGICGFGLGAPPNAMANMSAVCYKYRYTVKPFLIVPIIGAIFADVINTAMITLFLNLL